MICPLINCSSESKCTAMFFLFIYLTRVVLLVASLLFEHKYDCETKIRAWKHAHFLTVLSFIYERSFRVLPCISWYPSTLLIVRLIIILKIKNKILIFVSIVNMKSFYINNNKLDLYKIKLI